MDYNTDVSRSEEAEYFAQCWHLHCQWNMTKKNKEDGHDSWRCLMRADKRGTGTMNRQMDRIDPTNSVRIRLS